MRYASICDGIGAAHVAAPEGWECAWTSEIESFPAAVVEHHYGYKNVGDMTKIDLDDPEIRDVQILVGGPPCQAFSLSGLRSGLDDPRGQITLCYARMIRNINPKYAVFENVPGILSDKDNALGNFFAALVGEDEPLVPEPLAQGKRYWRQDTKTGQWIPKWPDAGCVYGPEGAVAWRVLDAQYFGVAQRRRRVFVVRCPRNGSDPAEILFEFDGYRRDTPPSRKARQENPGESGKNTETESREVGGTFQNTGIGHWSESPVAGTIRSSTGGGVYESNIVAQVYNRQSNCEYKLDNIECTVSARDYKSATDLIVFDPDKITNPTNNSKPLVGAPCHTTLSTRRVPVIAFSSKDSGGDVQEDLSPTIRSMAHKESHANGGGQIAVCCQIDEELNSNINIVGTIKARTHSGGNRDAVVSGQTIRRITPRETERLFGFPEDYTLIPTYTKKISEKSLERVAAESGLSVEDTHQNLADYYGVSRDYLRSKGVTPDGRRYKVLGNSMAVPCMKFIFDRIQADFDCYL